jgi:hypothetical protein
MNPVKSPLAAVGGLLFLIDAVVLGALGLVDDPGLQKVIVWSLVGSMVAVILMVWWMIWYILVMLKEPWWLFDPAAFHPATQLAIFARGERHDVAGPDLLSFQVAPPDVEDVDQ